MVYKNTTDTSVYIQTVMTVAWVLFPLDSGMTAPQAAGVIHSDFEKGFIRAETVSILIRSWLSQGLCEFVSLLCTFVFNEY
jgi:ribosome-binding ATPase YchF (GTP1/OBG family)